MNRKTFTNEEMELLMQNPYVLSVTPCRIVYSLEFKKFVIEQASKGLRAPQIFQLAGFDPAMLGSGRMSVTVKKIKQQAKSPEGLKAPRIQSKEERMAKLAQQDYSKKQTKTAICELQQRIVHLEQQIEFLKKIQFPEN